MLGKPTVAGTRLTVELILERLAAGEGIDRSVESNPRLDGESVGGVVVQDEVPRQAVGHLVVDGAQELQ